MGDGIGKRFQFSVYFLEFSGALFNQFFKMVTVFLQLFFHLLALADILVNRYPDFTEIVMIKSRNIRVTPEWSSVLFDIANLTAPSSLFFKTLDNVICNFFWAFFRGCIDNTHVLIDKFSRVVAKHTFKCLIRINNHAITGSNQVCTFGHVFNDFRMEEHLLLCPLALNDFLF